VVFIAFKVRCGSPTTAEKPGHSSHHYSTLRQSVEETSFIRQKFPIN